MSLKLIKKINYFRDEKYGYSIDINMKKYTCSVLIKERWSRKAIKMIMGDEEPQNVSLTLAKDQSQNKLYEDEEKENLEKEFKIHDYYIYKNNLYSFSNSDSYGEKEKGLLIKEHYFKQEKKFQKLQKEIKMFEKLQTMEVEPWQSREPIPEEVRFSVWRRDGGKCCKCGSDKKLEFDHIIPFSQNGSNTERNIQLLCEKCNREKSDKI
jgi:hypothetical protein